MHDTPNPLASIAAEGPAHSPVQFGRLESHWCEVNGIKMHARISRTDVPESAPDVVLVHGLAVSSLYMVPTARVLARTCRVYAPDLPGFGLSDDPSATLDIAGLADALAAWMHTMGLHRAALVGNSIGCQTIVAAALRHPNLAERLVLQGPTVDPRARTMPRQIVRWLRNLPRDPLREVIILIRDGLRCGVIRLFETLRYALEDPIAQKLPHLHVPVLVVRGARDPIATERWVREMVRLLPHARLHQIPGVAHTLNFAAPFEFVRVMRPFLFESPQGGLIGDA